jgi:hypothetical protein
VEGYEAFRRVRLEREHPLPGRYGVLQPVDRWLATQWFTLQGGKKVTVLLEKETYPESIKSFLASIS